MMVEWVIVEWVRWVVHMYKGKECGRDGGRGAQLMREGCNHVRVTSEENHSKATVLRLAQLVHDLCRSKCLLSRGKC